MGIRSKIVFIVLPLIITPLLLTGVIATLSARNGITSVATQFLQFKGEELVSYAHNQWSLLESNKLQENESFVDAAKSAIKSFAINVTRNDTELIFAVLSDGTIDMRTKTFDLEPGEKGRIVELIAEREAGWQELSISGASRVAHILFFEPFGWHMFITEERNAFYEAINQILLRVAVILAISIALALVLLLVFTGFLTKPLRNVVTAMTDIITTNDLSKRVEVLYRDETGRLGHTFNIMVSELQSAYDNIKGYALRAVVAQMREQKIRNIFQKYVPKNVIEQFFANPEAMLIGQNRVLSILFSDIRSFTSISERMKPDELVESLNQYFTLMVDTILNRNGIVDKYIGDAIMAFFGAPVRRKDDALQSVLSALEMVETLRDFNTWQERKGRPAFRSGIGISFGNVTVGNIGSEKKMDYTVIGDMVNLASRLEGLTKKYKGEVIIVSESIKRNISTSIPCRLLDKVIVKGRTMGEGIYGVRKSLSSREEEAWEKHQAGMDLYYDRSFEKAAEEFGKVLEILPNDFTASQLIERCRLYMTDEPDKKWTGVVEMDEK